MDKFFLRPDMECPYCGAGQTVCHDDGEGYTEDELHQHTCNKCQKAFIFTTVTSHSYYPAKADCLNEATHNYQLTKTTPKYLAKYRCTMCDDIDYKATQFYYQAARAAANL